MPSPIHHPRALLDWQARALRCGQAHLYRVSHDGRGNWTVARPGSKERLYFSSNLDTPAAPPLCQTDGGAEALAPARPAAPPPAKELTPAEKHAAEVRSSYINLSA